MLTGEVLSKDEAAAVLHSVMSGQHDQADIIQFLRALNARDVTVTEITGLVEAMRGAAVRVDATNLYRPVIDTCGTGGDNSGTFNVSTAAALVIAGTDKAIVAKHGNRAASSKCGSADVLEALGVNLATKPRIVRYCLRTAGIGFMFAPAFHPAMKEVAAARRALGVRTIFNFLGPLTNPAGVTRQVIGVSDELMAFELAQVLQTLHPERVIVVNGADNSYDIDGMSKEVDGLDEIGISGPTTVYEIRGGSLTTYEVRPEEFGLDPTPLDEVRGGNAKTNAAIILQLLSGELHGPKRDIVVLNAAAGLYVAGVVEGIKDGIGLAEESIDSGEAMETLEKLKIASSQEGI